MTKELIESSRKRPALANIPLLILTVALLVSLVIAATVVSIGMARADTLGAITASGTGRLLLALFLGLAIAGMGGFTAAMVRDGEAPRQPD